MTPTGCCICNYLYVAAEVPLAEISFCICAAPIIRGAIAMLTLIALLQCHPEVIPWCDQFPMIVETRKQVLVTINRSVTQIAKPIPIYEKVSKVTEEQITTLYTTNELWEDYNSFPSYIKSSHQKILNSLCIMEEYCSCMSNMFDRVFNMEGILGDVQTRGTELVNDINPLGFVSREFNLIKEFILISIALEDLALIISCVVNILMFGLPPSIAALINRIVLDWIGHHSENSWGIDSLRDRVQVETFIVYEIVSMLRD